MSKAADRDTVKELLVNGLALWGIVPYYYAYRITYLIDPIDRETVK